MSQAKMPQPYASLSTSPPFLLDKFRQKYSWASGTARGTGASLEQYEKDLKNAFSEIDGLLAGFEYLDEMSPTQQDAACLPSSPTSVYGTAASYIPPMSSNYQYPTDITEMDISDEESEPCDLPNPEISSDPKPQQMATQWDAIETLREETEYHHQRFQTLQSLANDPILAQLREVYKDSKSIRKTGILIFRDILDGFQPRKLKEIFAFASLSYAVSQLLFKSGRINKMEILCGLKSWRDSISDNAEREAFTKLAQHLWPEAKDHLHFIPIPLRRSARDFHWPTQPTQDAIIGSAFMDQSSQFSLNGHPMALDPAENHIGNANSAFLEPNTINEFDSQFFQQLIDLTTQTREEFDFSKLGHLSHGHQTATGDIQPVIPAQRTYDQPWHPSWHPPEHSDLNLNDGNSHCNEITATTESEVKTEQLRETFVFLVVLVYMAEIHDLLHILSGRGLVAKPEKLYQTEEEEQKRFYRSARENFFEPRTRTIPAPSRTYTALLSVAKIFTRRAYLKSISEVKHYLISVAVAVFPPGEQFQQFVLWVMCGDERNASLMSSIGTQPEETSTAARNLYSCHFSGCSVKCRTRSGLDKHRKAKHDPSREPEKCPQCEYSNIRIDKVRDHFLSQHPMLRLPPGLQSKRFRKGLHQS